MPTQVAVSQAKRKAWNGIYAKGGTHNDRDVYEHPSGACIYYDPKTTSWNLRGAGSTDEADYSLESEDVVPPDGEWRCHKGSSACRVKAAATPLSYVFVFLSCMRVPPAGLSSMRVL